MGGSAACNRPEIVGSCGASRPRSVCTSTRTSSSLALTVLVSLLPPSAPAQDNELEQVFVTGSRIARPDFDSASPIVSVTQELFERVGSGTVETAINTLPQFVPANTGTSKNPSNGGQANLSLRGLGTTSTLVLLDGKRLMPANGNGVADVNIIPPSLIESVEIITGGASAVYGSDALAGVVNFKLKRKFDGVEIDGTWGQTDRGDGDAIRGRVDRGHGLRRRARVGGRVRRLCRSRARNERRPRVLEVPACVRGAGRRHRWVRTIRSSRSERPPSRRGARISPQDNAPTAAAFNALMASYGYAPGTVPVSVLVRLQRGRNPVHAWRLRVRTRTGTRCRELSLPAGSRVLQ